MAIGSITKIVDANATITRTVFQKGLVTRCLLRAPPFDKVE